MTASLTQSRLWAQGGDRDIRKEETRVEDVGNPRAGYPRLDPKLVVRKGRPIARCDLVPKQKAHLGVAENQDGKEHTAGTSSLCEGTLPTMVLDQL